MSRKHVASGSRWIDAPAGALAEILRDATALPEWNPAFDSVRPARGDGQTYRVVARGVLTGSLTYGPGLTMAIRLPGLAEDSSWELADEGGRGTLVTHRLAWSGPLARIIGRAQVSRLPGLRLSRLVQAYNRMP